ncbi:J domain-containing protein [Sphingomonas sp.]|uniref:J domain-containing protein n=1 Tax=Sphingomonas sp. TaxID=28214 RepID=UPI002FD9376F
MHLLMGWLVGERVGRAFRAHDVASGNALWGLFLWWALGWLGATAAYYNLGREWAVPGCVAALGTGLALCLHRPLASGIKQAMLNAIGYTARWVMVLSGGYVVVRIACAVLFGELKAYGLAGIPWQSLQSASLLCVAGGSVAMIVGRIFAADRLRLAKAAKARLEWQAAARKAGAQARAPAPPPAPAEDAWWIVLELDPNAGRAEAEAKAREMLKQYHPDRWVAAPRHLRAQAEHQTVRILKARAAARAACKADCSA